MFGLLGKIFGTEKALTTMVGAAKDAIDSLVYTEEEKAGDAAKARSEARRLVVKWMESTQGQKLARRYIAFIIVTIWAVTHITPVILSIVAVWVEFPERYMKSAKIVQTSGENISGAMMLILAFYFAAPYMGAIVPAALNRFGKKKNETK